MLIVTASIAARVRVSEASLVTLFAGAMLLGWLAAYLGVRRARCGAVPNWDWMLRPLALWPPQRRTPFISAGRAQVWFEWWQSGKTFPITILAVLPMFLWPLLLETNVSGWPAVIAHWTLLAPVFFGGFALFERRSGMMPFMAALPRSTTQLVGAKIKAATLSTLAAWMVVAVALPLAIVLTGNLDAIVEWLQKAQDEEPRVQFTVAIVAGAVLLVVWTWKRKVDRLFAALTGRRWIEVTLGCVCIPGYLGPFMFTLAALDSLWLPMQTERAVLLWLIAVVFLGRLLATAWALRQSLRQGLLTGRTVAYWVAGWLLLASGLIAALVWAIPMEPAVPVAIAVLFAMPMARLAASPLALAWNRHR